MGVRSLGNVLASYGYKFGTTGLEAVSPAPVPAPGLTATGGVISDYTDSGTTYRAHIFTSSDSFAVTDLGSISSTVEYLVVAGGGGGGARGGGNAGGGGGAGGLRTNLSGHPLAGSSFPVSVATYVVTVGGGGGGANDANGVGVSNGVDSYFGPPSSPEGITSYGGGHGGGHHSSPKPASFAQNGGSGGGGGGATPYAGGTGNTPTQSPSQGNPGGPGYNGDPYVGGGGGGAGGVGFSRNPSAPNPGSANGGNGSEVLIAEPPATPAPQRTVGDGGVFAGGGGGGSYPSPDGAGNGGPGGGGDGGPAGGAGSPGDASTGGGGGGGGANEEGGNGGSGIVVVRYQIDASQSDVAKASGGVISYYNNKTIHAFTSSGEFTAPATFNETVEYVVVGGGGAGGGPSAPGVNSYYGGGGGAGAYRKGSTPISTPQTINIQVGAGGAKGALLPAAGSPSYFGSPITSPGGGYGATWQDPGGQPTVGGGPGASSGGSTYGGSVQPAPGDPFSPTDASANTPTNGWGHQGGAGNPNGNTGGGGGAGGSGQAADASNGGDGGLGMQLPTTFRDPAQSFGAPGPTNTSTHNPGWTNIDDSGKYWLAGGGGGTANRTYPATAPGIGGGNGAPGGPYSGAGDAKRTYGGGRAALQNTGSGGGGSERLTTNPENSDNFQPDAGNGGSGLVLIAYPT